MLSSKKLPSKKLLSKKLSSKKLKRKSPSVWLSPGSGAFLFRPSVRGADARRSLQSKSSSMTRLALMVSASRVIFVWVCKPKQFNVF
tara:strand:- start:1278 stop:1538 length:261 start_codon:yes stop_codon:yes gene_type:complete